METRCHSVSLQRRLITICSSSKWKNMENSYAALTHLIFFQYLAKHVQWFQKTLWIACYSRMSFYQNLSSLQFLREFTCFLQDSIYCVYWEMEKPTLVNDGPRRLHVTNLPFRFKEADLTKAFKVIWEWLLKTSYIKFDVSYPGGFHFLFSI